MEVRSSGSPIAILGLEDSDNAEEKNMEIGVPVIPMTQSTRGSSPSIFSLNSTNSTNINTSPSPRIDNIPEGTKAGTGTVSKPPAKITMNIPTFPTFFPKLQIGTTLAIPPKKVTESQEAKTSRVVTNPLITVTTNPLKGTWSHEVKTSSPVVKPLGAVTTSSIGNPFVTVTINPVVKPIISVTTNQAVKPVIPVNKGLDVKTVTLVTTNPVSKPLITETTRPVVHPVVSVTTNSVSKLLITETTNPLVKPVDAVTTNPIGKPFTAVTTSTDLKPVVTVTTSPCVKQVVTVATNVVGKTFTTVTASPGVKPISTVATSPGFKAVITVTTSSITKIRSPEPKFSTPIIKPLVTVTTSTINTGTGPHEVKISSPPVTEPHLTETTGLNKGSEEQVSKSYNTITKPVVAGNNSTINGAGQQEGKYSNTVTKPLITVPTSIVNVPIPNLSPITHSINNKMVISPTAVTISNSIPSAGIGKLYELRGSTITSGISINKLPAPGPDPLDSNILVVQQAPQDPLVPNVPEEIPMEVDPANPVSEPLLFDLNSLSNTCSLPGCESIRSEIVTLFNFPRNRARKWCELLGIPHDGIPLKDLGSLKVCGGHFEPSQFVENSSGKVLKLTAMPRNQSKQNTAKPILPPVRRLNQSIPNVSPVVPESENPQNTLTLPPICSSTSSLSDTVGTTVLPLEQTIVLPPGCYLQPASTLPSNIIRSNNITITNRQSPSQNITSNLDIQKHIGGDPRSPLTQTVMPMKSTAGRGQNINAQNKLLANTVISTVPHKGTTASAVRLRSGPGPGPKSQRKAALSPLNPVVPLGPYARPTVKLRSNEVKTDDLANLVMPSEDWSVNIYPMMQSITGKSVFTISETVLNSDCVEIVRKSVTVQPTWGMKFSVMSRDMTHFNLGLAVSDISDIQAVLEKFASLAVCNGLVELSRILDSRRNSSLSIKVQVDRYVDNVYRSIECPLLLVENSGKVCKACQTTAQSFSTTKVSK